MRYLYCFLCSLLIVGCSKSEANFSVACETKIRDIVMQVTHLDFNFKANIVTERKIPTESGIKMDKYMIEMDSVPFFKEQTREFKIIDASPTIINFGNPRENAFGRVDSFDRTSLQYSSITTYYNDDGTIAEPLMEGMPNPTIDLKKCEKPKI